jgi:hypothetical protein
MTDDRIASLSSLDSWWGSFLVVSTVIVLLGVAAEALQFMKCVNQRPKLKHSLELGAFLVLMVGIAGELLGETKTISVGDQLYGLLNDKAGAANDRAATAEKDAAESNERARALEKQAEELRAKNLTLEGEIAPRSVDKAGCADISDAVKPFSGLTVRVATYTLDIDGGSLGWQIADCLWLSHALNVDKELASILPVGGFGVGVSVSGKNEGLVSAIKGSLTKAKVLVVEGNGLFSGNLEKYRPDAPPNPDAIVVVGVKPTILMK